MSYNGDDFERVLQETIFQAIFKEIESLREWYFYEPKHTQVNREFYAFLEKLSSKEMSVYKRVRLAVNTYRKFYMYMKFYYPQTNTIDIELLTEDIEAEGSMKLLKKRGRPNGSKNQPKGNKKGNMKKEVPKKDDA